MDYENNKAIYSNLAARWWKWVLAIPKRKSPLCDADGTYSNVNQNHSDVFFLCQTYEQNDLVPSRKVSIEAGRVIFMPIINWLSVLNIDGDNDYELRSVAKKRMDAIQDLEVTINGTTFREELRSFRMISPFFGFSLPRENILCLPEGLNRGISDGFWLFLKPLSSPTELSSIGTCSLGTVKIGVNYSIAVEH